MASKKQNQKKDNSSGKPKGALGKYNRILKIFGQYNSKLPVDRKLSVAEMRRVITSSIYPFYRDKPFKVREIQRKIAGIVDMIPPRQDCDINLLPVSSYAIVDWFAIDEHLERIMPNCIWVRVNAGSYGNTTIFNTRNYAYHKGIVRQIIENLRELADNESQLEFIGVKKLKAGKPNDGNSENYFIDFILSINGRPIDNTVPVNYKIKTKEGRQKAKQVRDIMAEKMSKLKSEKRKISTAKKRTKQKIEEMKEVGQYGKKYTSQAGKSAVLAAKSKIFNQTRALIEKDYKKGILTEAEYKRAIKKLYSNFEEGGEIK
jgi:hypothetical protein